MQSIVLIGIKHCGKSTLGKLLARKYDLEFVDSDAEIEKQFYMDSGSRCSCREIFKYLGEEKFRELEAIIIRGLVSDTPRIIALGGGAVSNPFLKHTNLKQLGRIVWLDIAENIAYKRVIKNGLPPFLADAENPRDRFSEMNKKRRADFSRAADITFIISEELDKKAAAEQLAQLLECSQ